MGKKTSKYPKGILGVLMKSWVGATKISTKLAGTAKGLLAWGAAKGGRILWVVACSTLLVAVPILFEVQREGQALNMERLVVEDFKKQGYTDQDLARMGCVAAAAAVRMLLLPLLLPPSPPPLLLSLGRGSKSGSAAGLVAGLRPAVERVAAALPRPLRGREHMRALPLCPIACAYRLT